MPEELPATRNRAIPVYLGLVAFSIAGTALSKTTGLDPGPIAPIASIATLAAGLAVLMARLKPRRVAIPVLVGGAAVEIVGLATGRPFGGYIYTGAWAPSIPIPGVGEFPGMLPFAWAMVAGAAAFLIPKRIPEPVACLAAGAVAAAVDFVMEPVTVERLGYWRWNPEGPLPGSAPWTNLYAWFLISMLAALWLNLMAKHRPSPKEAGIVIGGHLTLMLALWWLG